MHSFSWYLLLYGKRFSAVFNQHFSAHLDSFTNADCNGYDILFNIILIVMKNIHGAIYDKLKYKGMLILLSLYPPLVIGHGCPRSERCITWYSIYNVLLVQQIQLQHL